MPKCYDCLSEDVTVKAVTPEGFELWFCAEDWAAEQEFHEKVMNMLNDAVDKPEIPGDCPPWLPVPGTRGIVFVDDCHCPAASPGHDHWPWPEVQEEAR